MKNTMNYKKILTITMLLFLVFALSGCGSDEYDSQTSEYNSDSWYSDSNSGYGVLEKNEKEAYVAIENAVLNYEESVNLALYKLTASEVEKIWYAYCKDNPLFFWCDAIKTNRMGKYVYKVTFKYCYSLDEKDRMLSEITARKDTFLSGVTNSMSDYEKAKTIHDNIVLSTEYDLLAPDNQNLYSVIVGNKSVCAGYSKAYQYLLREVGIYNTIVRGENSKGNSHCWNMVNLDGDYYYIDVTNDDTDFDKNIAITDVFYTYFGITTEERLKTCTIDETYNTYSICSATDNNYYVKESKLYNTESFLAAFGKLLKNHGSFITAKFPDNVSMKIAVEKMKTDYSDQYQKLRYIHDDIYNILTIQALY